MDIIIQSLGFKHSADLENFIHEKVGKLEKHTDKIIRANVTLSIASGIKDNNCCEIRLEVPGNDHYVKRSNVLFETAILDAVDVLQNVVRTNKEKDIKRRQGAVNAEIASS